MYTDEIEAEPEEFETHHWDEADEGDRRYDEMVERALFDPQTHQEWLMHHRLMHPAVLTMPDMDTGTPEGMEPESERTRRQRTPYREAA